jgi:hypothetical protein
VQSSNYWSSATYAGIFTSAWGVDFLDGYVFSYGKGFSGYVWCVRRGP